MAKSAIMKKFTISASGVLDITEDGVALEIGDTGELISLDELLADFADKPVKISVAYDEEY